MPQPQESRSPHFSVALCSFNGRQFIDAQVESIFAQTLAPAEIIAVDDGSADGTRERLEELAERSPVPMRVERNPERLGPQRNFERTIALCREELIALSDQDDVWVTHKLERMAGVFAAQPEAMAVFSDAELVDEELQPLGRTMFGYLGLGDAQLRAIEDGAGFDAMLSQAMVTGATLAFRRALVPRILPMPPPRPGLIHDRWIALAALASGRLAVIREPLVRYRQHRAQLVGTPPREVSATSTDKAFARDAWDLGAELELMRELRGWIHERAGDSLRPGFAGALDDRIAHLELRRTLPPRRMARVAPVAKELLRGGYGRWASGWLSALKDLALR
jgi:glycosyltransferase involved in cell wall biosynthesis